MQHTLRILISAIVHTHTKDLAYGPATRPIRHSHTVWLNPVGLSLRQRGAELQFSRIRDPVINHFRPQSAKAKYRGNSRNYFNVFSINPDAITQGPCRCRCGGRMTPPTRRGHAAPMRACPRPYGMANGKALGNGRDLRVQDGRRSLLRPVKSKCRGAHTLSSQQSLKVHDRRGLVRPRSPRLTSADSDIQISPPDLRFLVDAA